MLGTTILLNWLVKNNREFNFERSKVMEGGCMNYLLLGSGVNELYVRFAEINF